MVTGKNLIDGVWQGSEQTIASGDLDGIAFAQATATQVEAACLAARRDFRDYGAKSRSDRAVFLRTIAEQLDVLGDEIHTRVKSHGLRDILDHKLTGVELQIKQAIEILSKGS